MTVEALRLCLVTHLKTTPFSVYKPLLLKAIRGGITSIQLREKTPELTELRYLALQLKQILRPFNIPLIINDHVELAAEIDAEGVHIGQSDLSPMEARKILGPGKIIGLSIETMTQLEAANQLTCIDCIAASTVFPTKTKLDCKTMWGIEGLQRITRLSRHPVIAIGGINLSNIKMIMESGAWGAAVISAIHDAPDPKKAATNLAEEINQSIKKRETRCLRK